MPFDALKKLATPDRTARPKIVVNGVPVLPDHKTTFQEVKVEMEINRPSMWTVRLAVANTGVVLGNLSLLDFFPRYTPGALVNVIFTTESIPVPMVTGPLTAIEPENDGEHQAVEIRGFDLMHRLRHGVHNRTYPNTTDSAVAVQVGLTAGCPVAPLPPTAYVYNAVQQYNQSNLEFLLKRADRIGYELVSEIVGVSFRYPPKFGPPAVTLKNGRELLEFNPKMRMLTQGETVQVYSYDLRSGTPIITTAIPEPSTKGIDGAALSGVAAGMPLSPAVVVDQPVQDQAEAQILAQAAQDKAKRNFVTARGRCIGDPKIRPGQFIFVQNVGSMFLGLYYVTKAVHTIDEEGYYTDFECRRDAL